MTQTFQPSAPVTPNGPFEMPTPPVPQKSNHVLRWIGAGVVGLVIVAGIASSNHSSSSGNTGTTSNATTGETSPAASAASVESEFVSTTCNNALSVPISDGTDMTIGDDIELGNMTVSQAANAFAGGYFSSNSSLSYSQIVSACISGLEN